MRDYLKRNMLWVAMPVVVIPLVVSLSLQYGWLVSLQETSAIAKTVVSNSWKKSPRYGRDAITSMPWCGDWSRPTVHSASPK